MDLLVDGIAQVHLGDVDVVLGGEAVGTEDCLTLQERVPIWGSVDDVVHPRKGDAHTACLDLQQHDRRTLDEGKDVAHRTRGQKHRHAEFRTRLVDVLDDAELRDGVSVCLDGTTCILLGLAVEDLVGDVLLCQTLRDQVDLVAEVRDDHRRLGLLLVRVDHFDDTVDLGDASLVPVLDVFALFLCQTAPAAFGVQDDLRMNGRLALPEHHQDDHRTDDVAGQMTAVGVDPLHLLIDPLRDDLVQTLLFGMLKVVDLLGDSEFRTLWEDIRTRLAQHHPAEDIRWHESCSVWE